MIHTQPTLVLYARLELEGAYGYLLGRQGNTMTMHE
jgi:hypothetical protein